jgi:negative regulator of flagellin synthesis FlgM
LLALGEISVPAKIGGYSTSEPVAPLKGSNSGGVVADKSQSEAAPAAASTTSQTGDHLTLTANARSLHKLSDVIAQAPVVNTAKVAALKQAVTSGTYQIDSARVAHKILQFESGLK